MNAHENQIVVYQPNETVRLDREFYLVSRSQRDFGKVCFGLVERGAGEVRRIGKESFVEAPKDGKREKTLAA